MTPLTRRWLLVALCLGACLVISQKRVGALTEPWRNKEDVIRLLRERPVEWPANIIDRLLEVMPNRIINSLSYQSTGSVTAYLTKGSSHPLHPRRFHATFYVVSAATGGSFVAMTRNTYRGPVVVWDTLMPPSILFPQLSFANVDGDSVYEAICSGQLLNSNLKEWVVIDWDSTGGHLLAPRLDQPAPHIMANRLIGRELRLVDDSTSVYKDIEVIDALPVGVPPEQADSTALGVRMFHFNQAIGGYLPID